MIEQRIDDIMNSIKQELVRATAKFPTWPTDPLHAVTVLNEEVGELNQAILQMIYEPHKSSQEHIQTEAMQSAAMAIRFLLSMSEYVYAQSLQHKQV